MLDPRTRLLLVMCVGTLAISLDRPTTLLCLSVVCALPLIRFGVSGVWWRRGAIVVAGLIWATVLSQGMFYSDEPRVSLAQVGPIHFYREGAVYGLAQSLRFIAVALSGLSLVATTPPTQIHQALVRLKIPFGIAVMVSMAFRFLPDFAQELLDVRMARAARGRSANQRGPVARLKMEVSLLRPVVARALRRAWSLAESLDARGFDPYATRTSYRVLTMTKTDVSVIVTAVGFTVTVVSIRVLFLLYTSGVIYRPELRELYGFVRRWM